MINHFLVNSGELTLLNTIIHIGQHKTGTTSTQHFLKKNMDDFSKRGLYVPDSICWSQNPSHYLLNVYALNENRYSPMKESLLKEKPKSYISELKIQLSDDIKRHYWLAGEKGCRDVIWSNEGLYLLNSAEEYQKLRDLFGGVSKRISVICCFREKESYKNSYYQQLIKQGFLPSSDKDSYKYINDDSWLSDYEKKIKLLHTVFDDVITYAYDPHDNVSTFLQQIGYPTRTSEPLRLNVTHSYQPIT